MSRFGRRSIGTLTQAANNVNQQSVWTKPLTSISGKTYSGTTPFSALNAGLATWEGTGVPIYRVGTYATATVQYRDNFSDLYNGIYLNANNTTSNNSVISGQCANTFPTPYNTYSTQQANAAGSMLVIPSSYDKLLNPTAIPKIIYSGGVGIRSANNPDSHLVIIQPDGTIFESYATIILNNGNITCSRYKLTKPSLGGDGWQNGVRASMIPTYMGVLTAQDLSANTANIGHAIACVIPATQLTTSYVFPALAFDRNALSNNPAYSGTIPMGARLAIPMSTNIETVIAGLESPQWYPQGGIMPKIARCMQNYGIIVVDRGGAGVTLIDQQGPLETPYDFSLNQDIETLVRQCQVVTVSENNFFHSG